jgi:hypothetical protein
MRWFVALAIIAASVPLAGADPCPQSCFGYSDFDLANHCSANGVVPETCAIPPIAGSGGGCCAYDLGAGTWHLYAPVGNAIGGFHMILRDDYTLVGPMNAQPVAITARLHVLAALDHGCFEGGPAFIGNFASSTGPQQAWNHSFGLMCGMNTFDETFDLALLVTPGTPFRLTVDINVSDAYSSTAGNGALAFPDLPSGYQVVSCQGFTTGTVAVTADTWTRVKHLYRD